MDDRQFAACMARIKESDKNALHEIYDEYVGYIYSIVLYVVQNQEDAEDVTSEFFIKLWKLADTYQSGTGHKSWMGTIARNMAIDLLRKKKREILTEDFVDSDMDNASDDNIEQEVISDISLVEALNKLKQSEREIINLKIMGEMTFKEIAETLLIPIGTVTWRYQNAINKLRRYGYE